MTPHFLPSFLPRPRLWRTIDIAFALARPYLNVCSTVACAPPSLNSLQSLSHSSSLVDVVSPVYPVRSTPRSSTSMPSVRLARRPRQQLCCRGREAERERTGGRAPQHGALLLRNRVRPLLDGLALPRPAIACKRDGGGGESGEGKERRMTSAARAEEMSHPLDSTRWLHCTLTALPKRQSAKSMSNTHHTAHALSSLGRRALPACKTPPPPMYIDSLH